MHSTPFQSRDHSRDVVVLVAAALVVRVIWLWFGSWMANDSTDYLTIAGNILDHGTFSLDGAAPTSFRPPVFPALIALIWSVFGRSVFPILIANVALGCLTVGLAYLIAARRFTRSVALLAGGALALAPMTSFYTVTVLTESLFTFLATLAIYLWCRGQYAIAGISFGLAALTRPTLLPFLVIIALLPLMPAWRPAWRSHITMVAVAISIIGIWTIRNAMVFGRFVPVSSVAGISLLSGTLETDVGGRVWDGANWSTPGWANNPVTRVDEVTDEIDIDKLRFQRAISRIADHPGDWLIARIKQYPKLYIDNGDYLLGDSNLPLSEAYSRGNWWVVTVKFLFITGNLAVIALAAFGLWMMRGGFIPCCGIWLFPLFGAIVHIPLWIEPRYLLPMMPMIFVLAAVGVHQLLGRDLKTV